MISFGMRTAISIIMTNAMKRSNYISAAGNPVTLYQGPKGKVTVVVDKNLVKSPDITVYDIKDECCGAASIEAALQMIGYKESCNCSEGTHTEACIPF